MSIIIITFANSHELLLLSEIYKSCSTTVPQNSLCQPLECFSCLAVIHCLLLFHLTAPTFFLSPPPLFFFKIQPAAASCICLLAMKRCAINMLVHVMNYSCSPPLPMQSMSSSVSARQKEDFWRAAPMYLPADCWASRAVVPLKGAICPRSIPATQLPQGCCFLHSTFLPEAEENSQIELFKICHQDKCRPYIWCVFHLLPYVQKNLLLYIQSLLDLISERISSDSMSHISCPW